MGTCVGKRNHRFFLMFSVFTSIHAAYTAAVDVVYLKGQLYAEDESEQYESADEAWNAAHVMAVILLVYTCIILCCVGGLAGYHSKLAIQGRTTNEELRGKYINSNPYDMGCRRNCWAFCYGGVSRVYVKGRYDTETLSAVEPNVFVIKRPQQTA